MPLLLPHMGDSGRSQHPAVRPMTQLCHDFCSESWA